MNIKQHKLSDEEKRAIAEIAQTAGTFNRGQRSTFAETIVQSIDPGQLTLDMFNLFLPVTRINVNDDVEMLVQRNRFVARQMVEGASNLADQVFNVSKRIFANEKLIAGATVPLGKIRSGEITSIADIRRQLVSDLTTQIASNVFNRLTTIWGPSETPNLYIEANALTKSGIDTLIENVYDRGEVRAIVGTRRALANLFEFAGYVSAGSTALAIPDLLREFGLTGTVSAYKGIPVVVLPQVMNNVYPEQNKKLVRDDIVIIVGSEAGQIALRGEMESQEHVDTSVQPAAYWVHVWQRYAIIINARERVGIYRITSA